MTKTELTELIAHQALRIAKLEQDLQAAKTEQVDVQAGLKLCDYPGTSASQLERGTLVRVNRSGDPSDPFMTAKVEYLCCQGKRTEVRVELQGVDTYRGLVALSGDPFASTSVKTLKVIEIA